MPITYFTRNSRLRASILATSLLVLIAGPINPEADAAGSGTVSGTLYLIHGDPPEGPPATVYRLVDTTGKGWTLNLAPDVEASIDRLAAVRGVNVHVTGDQITEDSIDVYAIEYDDFAGFAASAPLAISGSKAWATLLCKFNDVAAEPQNLSFFDGMMGTTSPGADHYWQELSYGEIDLTGSSQHDWLDLPGPRSDYIDDSDPNGTGSDLGKLFDDCKQVHEDNGVNFAGIFGINLMFNDVLDCCAWGGGSGGFAATWMPPWSWGSTSHGVLAQEMGHAFGLPHEGCQGTDNPYDSNWDPMSSARQIHTNAAFKDDLDWIPGSRKYVADNSVNQVVAIERLALPELDFHPDSFLMAEIPIPGGSTFYTVEARKFAGYDNSPQSPPFEAVVIHFVDWSLGDKNAVVVHEDDGNNNCNDQSGAWVPGELFVDPENGISIAVVSEESTGFTIAINPIGDIAISKTATPDPVVAGELVTYGITVDNLGPGVATNVIVTDTLPTGVNYVADTDDCVEGPVGTLTCTSADPIPPDESWSFNVLTRVDSDIANGLETSITNAATVFSDQDQGGTSNEVELTTFVVSEADLLVTKECKPDQPLQAGEVGTCTILVDNIGPSMASNVVVTDTHVSEGGFNFGPISTTQGFCGAPVAGVVTCNLGDLDAGDRATISVGVWSNEAGDINDCASAESATPDPNNGNNQACDGVNVVAEADLAVSKTDSPDPVVAGTSLTYLVTVSNSGPSNAVNVVVEDVLPAGVSIESVAPSAGSCNSGVPGDAALPTTCTFGSIASGASESITIVVGVAPDFLGLLTNDVSVSSDSMDSNNANNLATTSTTVVANADLSVSKSDSPDPVIAGETLKYTVTVSNNGPSFAQDVNLADLLPAGVSFVGAAITVGSGSCIFNPLPGTVTCNFDDGLAPSSSVEVVIEVQVDPSIPHGTTISNTATVSATTPDGVAGNNSATEETTVNASADLGLTKDSTFEAGNPSTNLIYILTATNLGSSDAQNVSVVDTFPSTAKKLVYVFDTGNGACSYDRDQHQLVCDLGTLAAGDSWSVEIHMNAKGKLGTIRNTATVSSTTLDGNTGNNTATKDVIVGGGTSGGGGPKPGRGRP
jgi:uncharacterized repeat protein (TIGR01451 family)